MEKIIETITDGYKDLSEIVRERVFSPMYFYFIIAWVITNWKFAYALIFLTPEFIYSSQKTDKITFLSGFYSMELWLPFIHSVSQLLLIPAISTFVIVWWFSHASEKFYEKTEKHKQNKRAIKRAIEYTEDKVIKLKLNYAKEAFDKQENALIKKIDNSSIAYKDNDNFNRWFDDANGDRVQISDLEFYKSEILYYTDFESYKSALNEWKTIKDSKINDFQKSKNSEMLLELVDYADYFDDDEVKKVLSVVTEQPLIVNEENKDFIYKLLNKE